MSVLFLLPYMLLMVSIQLQIIFKYFLFNPNNFIHIYYIASKYSHRSPKVIDYSRSW